MFGLLKNMRIKKAIERKDWEWLLSEREFTPRVICGYLGVDLPEVLDEAKDRKATIIAGTAPMCEPGCIYFVNKGIGDAFHARNVRKAFAAGAFCVFSRRPVKSEDGALLPCIPVEEPSEALIKVLAACNDQRAVKTIALTGSIGKTSAKEMLHLVSAVKYKTVYSRNNQNGFGQVVRWRQRLPKDTEVFIQEAGMSKPGSIDRAGRILAPDAFVVTNIGLNHVGYFGGKQENILAEKLNLDKHASKDAVGFVNWDDPLLREAQYCHRVVSFAVGNKDADFYAEDIVEKNGQIRFNAVEKKTGEKTPVLLNVVGRHNVGNALTALAVGCWLGIPKKDAAKALEAFEPKGTRQNLVWLGGQHVYIDCYNASEGAIASTVATMNTIDVPEGGKRILVLGDIDDKLGERTEEIHRRVGVNLAKAPGVDLLLAFGAHAAWAAEEAAKGGKETLATEDRNQLEAWIHEHMAPEDLIAFKGGQQMMLSRTIDNIFGTALHMLDTDVTRKIGKTVTVGGKKFCLIDEYGAVFQGDASKQSCVEIPEEVEGQPVRMVGALSFSGSNAASVIIPEPVRTIARNAFIKCANLREVKLPSTLECIESGAFNSCKALKEIRLPEGVATIGKRAFYARKISKVYLPESVKSIDKEAFFDHAGLKIECPAGSYAAKHIKENYRSVKLVEK